MNTWDVLSDAADIIERHGHIKGDLWRPPGGALPGGHCVVGAIRRAVRNSLYPNLADAQRAELVLTQHLNATTISGSVPSWNDKPWRTAAEVVSTLRMVAALEKAQHAAEHAEHTPTTTTTPLPALV
jgi:hypothetical protein